MYKFLSFLLPLLAMPTAAQLPAVTTRSFDNSRSGDNLNERILTVASVQTRGLVLKTTIPVVGDARGMEAQPLILPGVTVSGMLCGDQNGGSINCPPSVHDVMVLPSMANVVRGVDAETGAGLWQTALGMPVQGSAAIDMHRINDKWGVLSTPVADPSTGLVYMVVLISPDGTPQKGVHWLYTLNAATGAIAQPPVSMAQLNSATQAYNASMRKQRSALLMTTVAGRKTIFFAYGTVLETQAGAAGAITAYDVATNSFTAFMPTSRGVGAGIWQGGQGCAADVAGYLYCVTGNGSFDGVTDFGESIIKVKYTPPSGSTAASLTIVDHWSPYSDAGRVGLDPTRSDALDKSDPEKLSGVSAPSVTMSGRSITSSPVGAGMEINMAATKVVTVFDRLTGTATPLLYPTNPTEPGWSDEDLGSGGCTLLTKESFLLCSGKDGIGYLVKTANMGGTVPADFANAKANCAKLAAPPFWMTASPGPVDPCPQDPTTLNFFPWGKTRHMHMTPVQYRSPVDGLVHIFAWGENSYLQDWSIKPSGSVTYVARGNEAASIESLNTPGGMPGGFCTLSSNGNAKGSAILWCSIPYGDANSTITNGRLLAYDPENLITNPDGSKSLRVLWDSQRWGIPYIFNKFMAPIVWNGEVILPNYNGGVLVFTLGG